MTPIGAAKMLEDAAAARREHGVRTLYSVRERALVAVLLDILKAESYGEACQVFERESDGLMKVGTASSIEGGDGR